MDMKGNKIIAVDFDGTLCTNAWPEIGYANEAMLSLMIAEKQRGSRIILWTCRCGELLTAAVEWCRGHGLEFDAVNENLPELIQAYGNDCRKVNADLYIDDKNVDHAELVAAMRSLGLCGKDGGIGSELSSMEKTMQKD